MVHYLSMNLKLLVMLMHLFVPPHSPLVVLISDANLPSKISLLSVHLERTLQLEAQELPLASTAFQASVESSEPTPPLEPSETLKNLQLEHLEMTQTVKYVHLHQAHVMLEWLATLSMWEELVWVCIIV